MATDLHLSEPIAPDHAHALIGRFQAVRQQTEMLCDPLEPEDYGLQPMTETSPAKWHLAHSTWFFETFVVKPALPRYRPRHPEYNYLFNSYYNTVGERIPRNCRGLLSRPTVGQVYRYREAIDDAVRGLLDDADHFSRFSAVIELGLQHEQQHQELILTDLKAALACNPLWPAYRDDAAEPLPGPAAPLRWKSFDEGLRRIGHDADSSTDFAYDNEGPRHRVFLESFQIASRPSTVGEFLTFVEDGGYDRSDFWLSDGWAARHRLGWTSPAYWVKSEGQWMAFTLGGLRPLTENEPVAHLSFYEADAFARWSDARLPTEAEWEAAAVESGAEVAGNFVENTRFHPSPLPPDALDGDSIHQLFGDVWEWTASPYVGYPGYQPAPGALGEYNGKFMCNQFVLRGGSCASPRSHLRATYRNFFPPEARWQFNGVRLARS